MDTSDSINGLPQSVISQASSRRLLNESHSVFTKLQDWSGKNEEKLSLDEIVQASREYRSILRSAVMSLEETRTEAASYSEVTSLVEVYRSDEMVWSLIEALCLRPKGSAVAIDLIEWAQWNFTQADVWIGQIMSDSQAGGSSGRIESHDRYWDTIYAFALFGRCEEAHQLLQLHPRSEEDAFKSCLELLRKIPLNAIGVDQATWRQWQEECHRRLSRKHFEAYPEIEQIIRVLTGDEAGLSQLSSLFSSWYEVMVPLSLYKHPNIELQDLSQIIEEAFRFVRPGPDKRHPEQLRPLDSIVCAIFELDMLRALKELSSYSSDWWLTAHLADLLSHAGCPDLSVTVTGNEESSSAEKSRTQMNLRELLVLDYGKCLLATPSLWQLGLAYLDSCPIMGMKELDAGIEAIPLDSERKILKILQILEKRGLNERRKQICRNLSTAALDQDEFTVAMGWCIASKDPGFAGYMAEEFLKREHRGSLLQGISLLEQIGDAAIMSPSLIFLGKYREFQVSLEKDDLKKASQLLCDLIVSKIAPRSFWVTLMSDAVPLLTNELDQVPLFDVEQSHRMMDVLHTILTEIDIAKSQAFYGKDYPERKVMAQIADIRQALLGNLAVAIVS